MVEGSRIQFSKIMLCFGDKNEIMDKHVCSLQYTETEAISVYPWIEIPGLFPPTFLSQLMITVLMGL